MVTRSPTVKKILAPAPLPDPKAVVKLTDCHSCRLGRYRQAIGIAPSAVTCNSGETTNADSAAARSQVNLLQISSSRRAIGIAPVVGITSSRETAIAESVALRTRTEVVEAEDVEADGKQPWMPPSEEEARGETTGAPIGKQVAKSLTYRPLIWTHLMR